MKNSNIILVQTIKTTSFWHKFLVGQQLIINLDEGFGPLGQMDTRKQFVFVICVVGCLNPTEAKILRTLGSLEGWPSR